MVHHLQRRGHSLQGGHQSLWKSPPGTTVTTGALVAWQKHTVRVSIVDNPRGTTMSTTTYGCLDVKTCASSTSTAMPQTSWSHQFLTGCHVVRRWKNHHWFHPVRLHQLRRRLRPPTTSPVEVDPSSSKRDGPESRAVTIGPESKKQRTSWTTPPSEFMADTFLNMARARRVVRLDDESHEGPSEILHASATTSTTSAALFYMSTPGWLADLQMGNIFRVDSETDLIGEDDVYGIWPQCEEGDSKEIGQFVDQDAFKPVRRDELGKDCAIINAIWVRKWKRTSTGKIVKSRLCARGCHDPWKHLMSSRPTTATRLSQRLILPSAANVRGKILQSWDVAGAF